MTWVRIDDRLHDNRKIKRLWLRNRGALALHLLALSYSGQHETDGVVDDEFVTLLAPGKADRQKLIAALVDAGLWGEHADGWQINDFLEYNPSAAELQDRRRRDADRKARGRQTQSEQRPRGRGDDSGGPVPSRPDPTQLNKTEGSTNASKAASVERGNRLGAAA